MRGGAGQMENSTPNPVATTASTAKATAGSGKRIKSHASRRASNAASESSNDMFDVNRLEERAMVAFGTLETILHTHEQRLASENVRNQELQAIENRVDSLKEELHGLFGRCQDGWQREMDQRYEKFHLKRAIHAGETSHTSRADSAWTNR